MLRRATALKRICDRQRVQNAVVPILRVLPLRATESGIQNWFLRNKVRLRRRLLPSSKNYGIQVLHYHLMNFMRIIVSDIRSSSASERLPNRKESLPLRNINCSQTVCRWDLLQIWKRSLEPVRTGHSWSQQRVQEKPMHPLLQWESLDLKKFYF